MVDITKDFLLKYKLIILVILILAFIASCHCIKPPFLTKRKITKVKQQHINGDE